jgi:hypothetical protein
MAPIGAAPTAEARAIAQADAWNEAYDRLLSYLNTFELGDHAYVSQLALNLLHEAQEEHQRDPSKPPVRQTLDRAHRQLTNWLATNLEQKGDAPEQLLATGYVALLLSRAYRVAPTAFLAKELPEELRHAMRETLVVTGPDLNVSSMTPRHLDYGPMLQFARQTWHRIELREFLIAIAFWSAVYTIFYWWLSQAL